MRDLLTSPLFSNTLDSLMCGIWEKLDNIKDGKLKTMAASLPNLLSSAYADSTLSKYKSAWKKWISWSSQFNEVTSCPADPFFIAIYLNDIVSKGGKIGTLETAIQGIRWGHINSGFLTPTDLPFVKLALEGGKRIIARSGGKISRQKEPLDTELLKKIVQNFGYTNNLIDLRFVIICLLGFSGFMRISEILSLKIKDISFVEEGLKVFVETSKTDQLREGHIIHISKTGKACCPVYWLKQYLSIANLEFQPESFLICRLAKTKVGHNAIGKYNISYSTIWSNFRDHLSVLTDDEKQYCTHSLRSGGASEAANNDVTDRLISKHGRWKSQGCRNRYIKDKPSKRFSVSKSLGI